MSDEIPNSAAPRLPRQIGQTGLSTRFAVALALLLSICATNAAEQTALRNAAQAGTSTSDLTALVRDVLQHEIREQAEDKSRWCYRKLLDKDGKQQLFSACQTDSAEIKRLMAVNGKPLTERQWELENQRIEKLLNSRSQLKKEKQQEEEDARQATNLLKMIPDAFLFQQESNDGDRIRLKFTPNPKFRPSGSSELVFHHMEGTLTLDLIQKRLVEISGCLTNDVKFGGGFLGHLDKGGTFLARQQEVAPGSWEMTTLDVQMNGRALFFKTIAVRTKEIDTDFRRVPPATSIQQVAVLTAKPDMFDSRSKN